jgi:serine protease Do
MHRTVAATSGFSLAVAALLACSNGQAATSPRPAAATAAEAPAAAPLFREASATAPAPEAAVPTQSSLAPLVERLQPAVVNISTTTVSRHPLARGERGERGQGPRGAPGQPFEDFFERYFGRPMPDMPEEFRGQGLGSGFILSPDGYILTNNHVVKDATDIRVRLHDRREFAAKVVGRDPQTDIALIKLNNPPKELPTAVLGDSDGLRVGDFVLALGSPFGLTGTATMGIVSAKHRAGINTGGTYDDFIQTDAAINPGNSGGPLFNLRGEVVGINTAIISPQIGQGIGFAVPITLAKALLPQLREKGRVTRGYLGVQISDLTPDLAQGLELSPSTRGALVQQVVPDAPAAKAGIEPDDVVIALNGKPVDSSGALTRGVALVPPGGKATLTLIRRGQKKDVTITVAERPESLAGAAGQGDPAEPGKPEATGAPKLGLRLSNLTPQLREDRQLGAELQGVLVTEVEDGGPADRAGVQAGDVITQVNRQRVSAIADVSGIVAKLKDGQIALLRVQRGQNSVLVAVPVGGRQ